MFPKYKNCISDYDIKGLKFVTIKKIFSQEMTQQIAFLWYIRTRIICGIWGYTQHLFYKHIIYQALKLNLELQLIARSF